MNEHLPSGNLIDVIKSCSGRYRFRPEGDYQPQFILFLGAGASWSSGVVMASDLTDDFRKRYIQLYDVSSIDQEKWYSPDTAYASLFERLYPEPSLRRDYIERILEYAMPGWGYFYLVNLLKQNIFNTVFTTNFDDLLNEACYLFSSDVRPICCAHDSSIRSLRMSSKRPKLIKLHGDFLYDNIKNTLKELESLEQNMRDKFKQYAREFGIIVIGYSGSIMDTVDSLLADDGNFPHGIFWCVRKDARLSDRVDRLTRYPKFHTVEIAGFDEFMAELHDALNHGFHPMIHNPQLVSASRMTRLLNAVPERSLSNIHPLLERDILDLNKAARDPQKLSVFPPHHVCDALVAIREGNIKAAHQHILDQIRDPYSTYFTVWSAGTLGVELLESNYNKIFAQELFDVIAASPAFQNYPSKMNECLLGLIKRGQLSLAMRVLDCEQQLIGKINNPLDLERCFINRAQLILRRRGCFLAQIGPRWQIFQRIARSQLQSTALSYF